MTQPVDLRKQVYEILHMYWGPMNDGTSLTEKRLDEAIEFIQASERQKVYADIAARALSDEALDAMEANAEWPYFIPADGVIGPRMMSRARVKALLLALGITESEAEG